MTEFPCKNCQDRKTGCHSTCEKYLAAKAEHDHKRAIEIKMETEQRDYMDYLMESKATLTKKFNRKVSVKYKKKV